MCYFGNVLFWECAILEMGIKKKCAILGVCYFGNVLFWGVLFLGEHKNMIACNVYKNLFRYMCYFGNVPFAGAGGLLNLQALVAS